MDRVRGTGLHHGVFFPFNLMFGEKFRSMPVAQASIDARCITALTLLLTSVSTNVRRRWIDEAPRKPSPWDPRLPGPTMIDVAMERTEPSSLHCPIDMRT